MGSGASKSAVFGTEIGRTPQGVIARSSHYASMGCLGVFNLKSWTDDDEQLRQAVGNVYCGMKWQCVEFARRWLIEVHRVTFDDVRMAYNIMDLEAFRSVERLASEKGDDTADDVEVSSKTTVVPVTKYVDATADADIPQVGDVLLWHPEGFFRTTGHVAIVTEVAVKDNDGTAPAAVAVRVGEQNVTDRQWPSGTYSRELPATKMTHGGWRIHDSLPGARVLGWVRPAVGPVVAR